MSAFFVSALLIFVAELGDKSQLVALWFATRYRWWLVVAGVSTATLVVHLGSVAIGLAFDELLPERWLLTLVGLSFFGFAAWSLRGDALDGEPAEPRLGAKFGAFGVVTAAFFLSELGDKTMLATVSLAGRESSAVGVWLGSTVGMVLADAAAIALGVLAGKRLPQRTIAIGAAALFVAFGAAALWSAWG
ncbi:TMEM165/GDT1 family protein [Tepidiforma sp.]|uniref:TMEM165/GDT1 family protein n=1 Tax=Tepidiforma sp. TaxID=2682230 RepID=UPI002ADDFE04|nr:TMEM165/GDT1 family protein [Tepidiforma sp.]